jgi:hypothetical protein
LWQQHFLQRRFPKVSWKYALLRLGEGEQLVQDASDKSANANLLKKFGVIRCFKEDTGGVERNWTVSR